MQNLNEDSEIIVRISKINSNALLNRKEMNIEVKGKQKTIGAVKQNLCAKFNVLPQHINIIGLKSKFGSDLSFGKAHVYGDVLEQKPNGDNTHFRQQAKNYN